MLRPMRKRHLPLPLRNRQSEVRNLLLLPLQLQFFPIGFRPQHRSPKHLNRRRHLLRRHARRLPLLQRDRIHEPVPVQPSDPARHGSVSILQRL
ncbi:hypothetical protein LINPERHAP1_LOCUS37481 [Linum perenne]